MRIAVLSTFDIWPARDGGQTRISEVWRNVGETHDVDIFVYDFRHTSLRTYQLSEKVRVVLLPSAGQDARLFYDQMEATSLWLHDALCLSQYVYTPEACGVLAAGLGRCDAVVASHPYLARCGFPMTPRASLKVYESHNVEFDVKEEYFGGSRVPRLTRSLLNEVHDGEAYACSQADLITSVSEQDRQRLAELYNVPLEKIAISPNGTNAPSQLSDIAADRAGRGNARQIGVFIGSSYEANITSYRRARALLHDAGFDGVMLVIGSIGSVDRRNFMSVGFEERWLGFVDEPTKAAALQSADFAIHLIFEGAGTNLKLFDYMAAGTPILANAFGVRGVEGEGWYWRAESAADLRDALKRLKFDLGTVRARREMAFEIVKSRFDWKVIAGEMARRLSSVDRLLNNAEAITNEATA